jgi:endo-1,4-beta-mannosidase
MPPFTLGINYWPRRSAMYMWEHFDAGEIREDAARIAAYGLTTVRFFLRWESFQPTAATIDKTALAHLVEIMDIFAAAKLRAMPTLFCGHMSGVNWLPAWTLDPGTPHGRFRTIVGDAESPYGIGDFYAEEKLLEAQERFARIIGTRLRDHPALYLWDLGNEFSNLREPKSPHDAANWSARLTRALFQTSGVGCTGGIHGEDVERDRHLRPSSLARSWEIATMHGYSAYSIFSRGGTDGEVVPYLADLIRGFTGKPLLFSEFGNPACPPGSANAIGSIPCFERLHERGAIGAMWWCWSDYDPALAHLPPFDGAPHELRFGILRADGSEKPVANVLSAFAAERRPLCDPGPAPIAEAEYYDRLPESVTQTYARYCRQHAE